LTLLASDSQTGVQVAGKTAKRRFCVIPHYEHFRDFISCQHGYIRKIIVMIKYIYHDKNLSDYQPLVLGISSGPRLPIYASDHLRIPCHFQ
jgi:hypothetical protein